MIHLRLLGRICDRRQLISEGLERPTLVRVADGERCSLGASISKEITRSEVVLRGDDGGLLVESVSAQLPELTCANGTPLAPPARLLPGDYLEIDGVLGFVHADVPPEPSTATAVWLDRLASGDDDARWTAAQVLGTWAPGRADVRLALSRALDDPSEVVRRFAERGLAHAGPRSFYLHAMGQVLREPSLYARIEIRRDEMRSLGRHPINDVVVWHPAVSKQHVLLRNDDAGWSIEDRGSCSGIIVSGSRHPSHVPVPVSLGDVLMIGPVSFSVRAE